MVCPNCGHEISPTQNFCENCGLPLKKNIDLNANKNNQATNSNQTKSPKENDSVRSLSDLERELDQQDKQEKAQYSQTKSQPTTKPHSSVQLDPSEVDDKTQVYNFKEQSRRPAPPTTHSENNGSSQQNQMPPILGEKVHLDPVTHLPVYPDDKPLNSREDIKNKAEQHDNDDNDGFFTNMWNFLKNNIYVDVIAIALVVILFILKRNYSWILLAIFIVAWFLTSQIVHGKEIHLNKLFKKNENSKKQTSQNPQNSNQTQQQTYNYQQPNQSSQNPNYNQQPQQQVQQSSKKKKHHNDDENTHKRNWAQRLLIFAAIVGFIASITGPFINQSSLSGTIASAANYTASRGGQSVLIMNTSSAIRFICFISPVIVLIAANFRNRGSIRLLKLFTFLPSIIYIAAYGLFYSGVLNASVITGTYVVGNTAEFGTSFYILIITSVLSLILAHTLHPRAKK